MEFSQWMLYASVVLIATVAPGPNILIVVVNTYRRGLIAAPFTMAGNLACLLLFSLVAATGIGALLHLYPRLLISLKLIGASYLIYLGIKLLLASRRTDSTADLPLAIGNASSQPTSLWRCFRDGFLISASNPKAILFLSSIFPAFLDPGRPIPTQFVVMFATIVLSVAVIHGAYALLAHHAVRHWKSATFQNRFSRVSGVSFIGFGVLLAPIRQLFRQA